MSDTATNRASGGLALGAGAPWIFAIVLVFVLPFIFTDRSTTTIMNQITITMVFTLNYNILLKQTNILSFNH